MLAAVLTLTCSNLAKSASPNDIVMRDVLVLGSVSRPGRSAVHTDALESQIVAGQWHAPAAGEVIAGPRGNQTWRSATADKEGTLAGSVARGAYIYWAVQCEREQVLLLEAAGHNCVYVNGEIRAGDPYGRSGAQGCPASSW